MFKSFEHFKAASKTAYDKLRSNPSMKLSVFRQVITDELGFKNPQSLKNALEAIPSAKPTIFIADQIAEAFNSRFVVDDYSNTIEFAITGDIAHVVGTDVDSNVEEFSFELDKATAELFDGILSIFCEGELVETYTVYERHKQPVIPKVEAFFIYVDSICDMALYINGHQVAVADTKAGDDSEFVVRAAQNMMAALGYDLEVIQYKSVGDWNWDEVWSDVSGGKAKDRITPVGIVTSSQDAFFKH